MIETVFLAYRQGVHVGTKADGLFAVTSPQDTDNSGTADFLVNFDSELGEKRRDDLGSPVLLKTQLGMTMNIVTPFLHRGLRLDSLGRLVAQLSYLCGTVIGGAMLKGVRRSSNAMGR